MKINLEKALEASKELIYGLNIFNGFKDYAAVYFVTTECIKDYLEDTEFFKGRALTILSGGDQVFNLIASGIYVIDAFDTNMLTYFVYQLRKGMINVLSFQDFKKANIMFTPGYGSFSKRVDVLEKAKKHIPEEVYEYYRKILELSNDNPSVSFDFLYFHVSKKNFSRNNYLVNEDAYTKLQKSVNDAKVHITFADALTLPQQLSNTYDIILLSNVADYFHLTNKEFNIDDFRKFIASYMKYLNPNGVLIHYLYGILKENPIKGLSITHEDLGIAKIHSVIDPFFNLCGEGYYLERRM